MIELDIVERLRGKVRVPVNDGAGLLDGKDFFERTFPTSNAALEAADKIEKLRELLSDALIELRHCRVFVTSREKIHQDGYALYEDLIRDIAAEIEPPSELPSNKLTQD